MIIYLMKLPPPRSTRTDTLFPYTTRFRSLRQNVTDERVQDLCDVVANHSARSARTARSWAGDLEDDNELPPSRPITLLDHKTNAVAEARSEEHTTELQSLMRISYAVF